MPLSRSPSPRRGGSIGSGEFIVEVPGSSAYANGSTSGSHVRWGTNTVSNLSSDSSRSFSRFNPRPQSRLGRAWRHLLGPRDHRDRRAARTRWSMTFQDAKQNLSAFSSTVAQEYRRGQLLPFLARVMRKLWLPLFILVIGLLGITTLSRRK
jgi:hypothetical protein